MCSVRFWVESLERSRGSSCVCLFRDLRLRLRRVPKVMYSGSGLDDD